MIYLFYIWIASIIVGICCLSKEEWHEKAKWFLCWLACPFPFIVHPKRFGYFKSWLLFLISPLMMLMYIIIIIIICILCLDFSEVYNYHRPNSIPYHTAEDLERITGVEFPEVTPIDSFYYDDPVLEIQFVSKQKMGKAFFARLDKACKEDTCCWKKDSLGYRYFIFPEIPIDRTKGTHIRKVEVDGKQQNDWYGDYVEIRIPFTGDTIIVNEGYIMEDWVCTCAYED